MAEGVIEITDASFKEVTNGETPVLIDFWAPWCGPCRAIAPIVEELAAENAEKIVVGKINVDECRDTATELGITSIPTLMIFKAGELVQRVVGAQSKKALQELIDSAI